MNTLFLSIALLIGTIVPTPTIVLINGIPHFVLLDEEFYINRVMQPVPDYFESEINHEEMVSNLISLYSLDTESYVASDIMYLDNVEFVQFMPERALLDRVAVNRIRKISQKYSSGEVSVVYLNIQSRDNQKSKILAENRLFSVQDLLISFGVDRNSIQSKMTYDDTLDHYSFVSIRYGK